MHTAVRKLHSYFFPTDRSSLQKKHCWPSDAIFEHPPSGNFSSLHLIENSVICIVEGVACDEGQEWIFENIKQFGKTKLVLATYLHNHTMSLTGPLVKAQARRGAGSLRCHSFLGFACSFAQHQDLQQILISQQLRPFSQATLSPLCVANFCC